MGCCFLELVPLGTILSWKCGLSRRRQLPASSWSVDLLGHTPRGEPLAVRTPSSFPPQYDDGSGMKREATADDLIKVVEELTRIH